MKCKDCNCCKLGHFSEMPNDYICTGVKRPFVIENVNNECTEYPAFASKSQEDNDKTYGDLVQNLNAVKWELKKRNDPSLDLAIKYIKDAIFEACRMNDRLTTLESIRSNICCVDDWWGD